MRVRGRCPGCSADRLLPGRNDQGQPLCRDCAGITRDFFCSRCGFEGLLLGGRLYSARILVLHSAVYRRGPVERASTCGSGPPGHYSFSALDAMNHPVCLTQPILTGRAKTISRADSAQVGDVIFFKWKQESRYNHAAVVRANSCGELHLVQHGIKTLTTLSDVIARYKNKKNSIEKILIVRVKDR